MSYNNNNNQSLADKLDDVILEMTSINTVDTQDAIVEIETQLNNIDAISVEYNAPDLRALAHWMMLNLELDDGNEEQINSLIKSVSYTHWIELLSILLRHYDQSILPELYSALVKPNWLIKPSIPILKNFAKWIDITKVNTDEILFTNDNISSENTNTTQQTDDDINNTEETNKPKHVFEEVDNAILEIDYGQQPIDIVDEFNDENELGENPLPLLVSEKTSDFYDEVALQDSEHQTLANELQDSQSNDINIIDIDEISDELVMSSFSVSQEEQPLNPAELQDLESKVDDISSDKINHETIDEIEHENLIDTPMPSLDAETIDKDYKVSNEIEVSLGSANEFNIEADDIVMTLSNISSTSEDLASISGQLIAELDRLNDLSMLFSYDEVSKITTWCQKNIELFNENQTIDTDLFVSSGESWSWIELINICLTDAKDVSHISSLNAELTRDEWFEPIEVEDLQNLLLFLRNYEDQQESLKDENSISKLDNVIVDVSDETNSDNINGDAIVTSEFKLIWDEDTHPELLDAYFEETPNIVIEVAQLMINIANGETSVDERHTASRLAHTIKGGSAVLGITGLADYAYQLEQILDYSVESELTEEANKLLKEASKCLEGTFEAVQNKGTEPEEFEAVYTRLCDYANSLEDLSLEDNDASLELDMPALPDFITHSNTHDDTYNNMEAENESEEVMNSEKFEMDSEEQANDIQTSLDDLNNDIIENDLSDFTAEIDDITMNLISICNMPDEVFNHIDQYNEELQRLELLAEISDYPEIAETSQWCQRNLSLFEQDKEETHQQFITSGEVWSWIELTGAALSDPTEDSYISTLSTELKRDDWAEPLSDEILQNLLLLLKTSNDEQDEFLEESIEENIDSIADEENLKANTEEISESSNENTSPSDDDSSHKTGKTGGGVHLNTIECIDEPEESLEPERNLEILNTDKFIESEADEEFASAQETEQENKTNEIISWDEDVHPELLAVYLQETPDQIIEVASLLHKISNDDASKDDHQHAARIAHTIKGASGVLGIDSLVKLTHTLEDILDYSVNNDLSNETAELLAESSDCLESLFEAVQNKQAIPEEYDSVLEKLTATADSISPDNALTDLELSKPTLPDFITADESGTSPDTNDENSESTEYSEKSTSTGKLANLAKMDFANKDLVDNVLVAPLEELVALGQSNQNKIDSNEAHIRVPVRVIDKLLNLAGELVTSSSQVTDKISNTLNTRKNIKEHDKRVHKMLHELTSTIDQQEKKQETRLASLKDSSFDSLEMDTYNELHSVVGLLTESILDSETIEEGLGKQLSDLGGYLRTIDQLNKELSEVILSSRMISVNTLVPRLERIVRETCRKTNKKAELLVTGNDINIDTDIINGLVDPLLHLLRNAVDHGIESPKDRLNKDKDEVGQISLDFKRQGNFIQMQLKDDGKGIDPEVIYERAIEKGLITPEQEFSTQEMLKLILHAGFTTQDSVSDISGRGVGMDVVKSAIARLKGSLEISSNIDKESTDSNNGSSKKLRNGTTFTIRIPLTLVTSATLLVKISDNQVAIPSDTIEQLYYLSPDKVIQRDNAYYIRHEGKEIIIESLAKLLGWPAKKVNYEQASTLVLIKADDKIHAVHIDEIMHSREVVIKSLSPWIDGRNGIIGASHLPDGTVAPVLNLPLLLSLTEDTAAIVAIHEEDSSLIEEISALSDTPLILVVDDSLSNRKALSLIIDQTDYDVITAVDGLDALSIMNEKKVAMVFTDLEMPRMNGLDFTQSVRAWKENKHVPVVMITSRTTSKHRQLAEKAGVDDYLTKPVVTDTLLSSIEQWIKQDDSIPA